MKDASIEFLEHHLTHTFKALMGSRIMLDMDWVSEAEKTSRAYGIMSEETELEKESNLIILFPPFFE